MEYKQEAVRLVSSGQRVAAAAKSLGIVEPTLVNWGRANKVGQLRGVSSERVSQMRFEQGQLRHATNSSLGLRSAIPMRSDYIRERSISLNITFILCREN